MRNELDDLSRIRIDMDRGEIRRRIRATTYRNWKPVLTIEGYNFEMKVPPG